MGGNIANIRLREAGTGSARSAMGGLASKHLRRHSNDGVSRYTNAARQFACRNAHHRHATRLKPSVTTDIALWPIPHIVTDPVNFDREPRLRAKEIEHVRPNRMLTTKHRLSRRALTQSTP